MNIPQMERSVQQRADLDAIVTLPPDEQRTMLDSYQSELTSLATEEDELLELIRASGTSAACSTLKALSRVARHKQSTQKALERLQRAIAASLRVPANTTYFYSPVKKEDGTYPPSKKRKKD